MRTALNFIAAVPLAQVIIWANSGHANPTMLLVIYGGYFIWAAVSTHLCTLLDWSASAYCSIWIVLTTESAYELWRVLIWTAQALGMRHLPLHSTPMLLGQLGFTIACCVTVRYTMARTMPEDGIYHIGLVSWAVPDFWARYSSFSFLHCKPVCASGCSHRR